MRVLVTGSSGSGTSTLGRTLAAEMGCSFFDADDYYWLPTTPPFKDKRDFSTRLSLLLRDLSKASSAVIAGSIMNWGKGLEDSFSLIVFLTLDAEIRVARLRAREMERMGEADEPFLAWAAQYDDGRMLGRSRMRHEQWLGQRACPVLRLDGDLTVATRVARVKEALSSQSARPTC
jgi:adenylate kinase family enzyme